jgi:alcohol dehydrogenase class IV
MDFEFTTATRIIFGPGRLKEVGPAVQPWGQHVLLVGGKKKERNQPLVDVLAKVGVNATVFPVAGEPTLELVAAGVRIARQTECDQVISMGGGSAIDAGKAIAALITNEGAITDYLEVIGKGESLVEPPVPFTAIPTTAGTGAEVTRNAVLASAEHRVKVSLRGPFMLPRLAVVDPELTVSLPQSVTASTGLDALTQLIEPYVCNRANPLTDGMCEEGMCLVARSLRKACEDGEDVAAREDMAVASLLSGMALANSGLGAVHGFAAPIGGMFPAPHGAVCAVMLPRVMDVNLRALKSLGSAPSALIRYEKVAQILTGQKNAKAEDGIRWIKELCFDMKIPNLRAYGVSAGDFPKLVEKASMASSMKANPIELSGSDLTDILQRSL